VKREVLFAAGLLLVGGSDALAQPIATLHMTGSGGAAAIASGMTFEIDGGEVKERAKPELGRVALKTNRTEATAISKCLGSDIGHTLRDDDGIHACVSKCVASDAVDGVAENDIGQTEAQSERRGPDIGDAVGDRDAV
jgi:hypothetical protein